MRRLVQTIALSACLALALDLAMTQVTMAQLGSDTQKAEQQAHKLDPLSKDRLKYDTCLALIPRSADRAIDMSLAWRMENPSSIAARHCEALALAHDRDYLESGIRLEQIAEDLEFGKGLPLSEEGKRATVNPFFVAEVWGQAANAWLLGDDLKRAEAAIDRALAFVNPQTFSAAPYLIDRAHIAAQAEDFDLAYQDLHTVLSVDPQRRDILVLLASAARSIGQLDEANSYLDTYEITYKDDPRLYLERGNLRDQQGRTNDARVSWLKVLELVENGPTADAARGNLQRLALDKAAKPENK